LTRIPVPRSSFAYKSVIAFSAAFEELYASSPGRDLRSSGSAMWASEPRLLVRFTIRAAGERRRRGSRAWVTATTPNTFVS
jgi:hypothetical protein